MFVLHNNFKDMKFVDRTDEIARLKDALGRENPHTSCMYGRRRLGKSTLIKKGAVG